MVTLNDLFIIIFDDSLIASFYYSNLGADLCIVPILDNISEQFVISYSFPQFFAMNFYCII